MATEVTPGAPLMQEFPLGSESPRKITVTAYALVRVLLHCLAKEHATDRDGSPWSLPVPRAVLSRNVGDVFSGGFEELGQSKTVVEVMVVGEAGRDELGAELVVERLFRRCGGLRGRRR